MQRELDPVGDRHHVDLEPFFEVLALGRWAWSSGHYRHGVTLAPLAARNAIVFGESLV